MDRQTALELLEWGQTTNPGPWKEHSLGVARAAEYIARECGMDAEKAWIYGAMHDIGRYEGVTGVRHIVAGYELMLEKGEPDIARICLTHSFPYADFDAYSGGKLDITAEDTEMVKAVIRTEMDDYDRLIQLCDALSWGTGVCLMEKRLMNVIMRHGVGPLTVEKIKAQIALREYFEAKIGKSIYSLFPEAAANTFGM